MLTENALKTVVHTDGLTQEDRLILCLATGSDQVKSVSTIRKTAVAAGLRDANNWNISRTLGRSKNKAIRTDGGWELLPTGRRRVIDLAGSAIDDTAAPAPVLSTLRRHLSSLSDENTRSFVQEAIQCFEARVFRAAVVFSWVGAVSHLQNHVINHKLKDFNAEADRRAKAGKKKWKEAKTADDLGLMKEIHFLEHLEAISVIGKPVRQELEGCLKRRNGCGHPNSYELDEHVVAAHVATLIVNVFAKF